ncbi:VWA domain-containing protein [Thermodesulfobacteriota bacterium]
MKFNKALRELRDTWHQEWEPALAVWSRFTMLAAPRWCVTRADEKREKIYDSFAMIRLQDHSIVISLRLIRKNKLEKFPREILAHEIGHHVYTPADLTDNARLLVRIRAGLPTREHLAGFVSNLYTDLLINDRLQRSARLNLAGVYKTLGIKTQDPLWTLYMRIYELLWQMPTGSLSSGKTDPKIIGDAQLGARLIRVYAKDWLEGAGRFAALCLPYLLKDEGKKMRVILMPMMDADEAGAGTEIPDGLIEIDPSEEEGSLHPSHDPVLTGIKNENEKKKESKKKKSRAAAGQGREHIGGQKNEYRSPDEYAEILKSLGVNLKADEITARYYRERALPHLVPFPARKIPEAIDPLPESLETWDIGSSIGDIDWIGTVTQSAHVVPGITTVQRVYGTTKGADPEKRPVDLYLGIDCSGSMPNPRYQLSFPVLAGAIMCLSALRAGARVMVVLSGEPGEFSSTDGFTRNEHEVMKVLTGYLGTGYAFGVMRLKDTFGISNRFERKTHILIITDADIFVMLDDTPRGWQIARQSLDIAGGGGTFILHQVRPDHPQALRLREDQWDIYGLDEWESLIRFARIFSRKKYEKKE